MHDNIIFGLLAYLEHIKMFHLKYKWVMPASCEQEKYIFDEVTPG